MKSKDAPPRKDKKETVELLSEKIEKAPVIGVLDFTSLPSRQLAVIKKKLRNDVDIKMSKKTLIEIALKNSKKKNIEEIIPKLEGQVALAFSDLDAFRLYSIISKEKSKAAAREGQTAQKDVLVKAGGTGIPPGPAIGEFQRAGLPARIEAGQIMIQKDKVLVEKGQKFTKIQADVLSKLGIEPMELGITMTWCYEDGKIYSADQLHVDEEEIRNNIILAHSWSFNLAVEVGYITEETSIAMIRKAESEAKALGVKTGLIEAEEAPAPAEVKTDEGKKEETPEKEEKKEEDAAEGLGSLFG